MLNILTFIVQTTLCRSKRSEKLGQDEGGEASSVQLVGEGAFTEPPLGLVPSQGDVSTCVLLVNKRAALRFHPPTCSMDFTSLLLSES